jgi:hypothetical protein
LSPKREETSTKSKAFLPVFAGGRWVSVAGPEVSESAFHCATLPLDPELAAHLARSRKAAIAERDRRSPPPSSLIGPHDAPGNILGGYRFPSAPKVNLSQIETTTTTTTRNAKRGFAFDKSERSTGGADGANAPSAIGVDLVIPHFLRRQVAEPAGSTS